MELRPFEEADIPRLIGWIPDARFLLQWAGPQYTFPLDAAQLRSTLEKTRGERPSHLMFNAQAIACYRALGFEEYERKPNARRFGEEYWTLLMMRLDRETWMRTHA